MLADRYERPWRDLRISVTDRCNFRCRYCMPKEIFNREYEFLNRSELLDFDEITRLARIAVGLGVDKVRITGGEPLLRRDLDQLIGKLAAIDGLADLTVTTNGVLLAKKAKALAEAGLHRVTVSLDSLDDDVFQQMNDVGVPVATVLKGIAAAEVAGLAPIKINMVVKRGVNEDSIIPMMRHFRGSGHVVRFIEYMDVGNSNGWRLDEVVPSAAIVEMIAADFPVEPIDPDRPSDVANRWRFTDGSGEFGVISSVTEPFCATCTRARISADGNLYTCLFASSGHNLKGLLRSGATDSEIADFFAKIWQARDDRYSEIRSLATPSTERVEMSYIGG